MFPMSDRQFLFTSQGVQTSCSRQKRTDVPHYFRRGGLPSTNHRARCQLPFARCELLTTTTLDSLIDNINYRSGKHGVLLLLNASAVNKMFSRTPLRTHLQSVFKSVIEYSGSNLFFGLDIIPSSTASRTTTCLQIHVTIHNIH